MAVIEFKGEAGGQARPATSCIMSGFFFPCDILADILAATSRGSCFLNAASLRLWWLLTHAALAGMISGAAIFMGPPHDATKTVLIVLAIHGGGLGLVMLGLLQHLWRHDENWDTINVKVVGVTSVGAHHLTSLPKLYMRHLCHLTT